jgi:hypothetical protein
MTKTVTLTKHFSQDNCETAMARRTYESDGLNVETADDVDELVADKRQGWRANAAKARRRQRRYKKRLTNEIRYQSDTTIEGEQD